MVAHVTDCYRPCLGRRIWIRLQSGRKRKQLSNAGLAIYLRYLRNQHSLHVRCEVFLNEELQALPISTLPCGALSAFTPAFRAHAAWRRPTNPPPIRHHAGQKPENAENNFTTNPNQPQPRRATLPRERQRCTSFSWKAAGHAACLPVPSSRVSRSACWSSRA